MSDKVQVFGLSAIYISGSDGIEEQIKAAQDASLSSKITLAELRGDDSLLPLAITPKTLDIDIKGKNGQISLLGLKILDGGTLTTQAAAAVSTPLQETEDSTIFTAIDTPTVADAASLTTNSWYFTALSTTTYQIVNGITGAVIGPLNTGAGANTTNVPGVSFTMAAAPALVIGSVVSFMTTKPSTGTIELLDIAPTDFGNPIKVRVITEATEGLGRFEFTFFKCISMGVVLPVKHKEYLLVDFEFRCLAGDQTNKAWRWKRLV